MDDYIVGTTTEENPLMARKIIYLLLLPLWCGAAAVCHSFSPFCRCAPGQHGSHMHANASSSSQNRKAAAYRIVQAAI